MNSSARFGQPLTERELRVVALVAHGYSNAEIGARMHISEDTVKTYVNRAMRKLGARNRTHAVTIAFCQGILSLPKPSVVRHD